MFKEQAVNLNLYSICNFVILNSKVFRVFEVLNISSSFIPEEPEAWKFGDFWDLSEFGRAFGSGLDVDPPIFQYQFYDRNHFK